MLSHKIYIIFTQNINIVRTKLIDLTAYIKGTPLPIINSEMDVTVDWDLSVEKKSDSATIIYTFESISGKFIVHESKELFEKTIEYKFSSDETWKFSHVPYSTDSISPTSAIINFDDKTVKIKF